MLCTRKAFAFLGTLAVAAWMAAAAGAQENYHMAAHDNSGETAEELSELRSEITELRSNMKASRGHSQDPGYGCNGYVEPSCGCNGHVAPSCGCGAPSCGCEVGCGCDDCGCGCDDGCGCGCGCDCMGTYGGFEPCCHSCGVWASAELLFLRHHRADGVRAGTNAPGEDEEFDFETSPRLTVGFVRSDGLGVRTRYWEFDHLANNVGEADAFVAVDTYNWDLEAFDTFALNCKWDLELSGGIRYNHFVEHQVDVNADDFRQNLFHGYGGIVAAEARRAVGTCGVGWARVRASILMDDKFVLNIDNAAVNNNVRLIDTVVSQVELAFGYDYVMPLQDCSYAFVRAQAEWQQWSNFTSAFVNVENGEANFASPSDVGFGGFGVAAGIMR